MAHVIVIGAGPAGAFAAYRAAGLGATTTLVTRDEFGGMAANDGPVPIRTLAHAVRLIREARQLDRYGIAVGEPVLNYPRLLERVREVAGEVGAHSARREDLDRMGVTIHEKVGTASFVDPHTIETASGAKNCRPTRSSSVPAAPADGCQSPDSNSPPPTAMPGA